MRDFKKYEIWQLGHELVLSLYKETRNFPKEELYGIISQIRRAAVSIPANIAEGCGRDSDKEFNYFLNIALGTAAETEFLQILSKDLGYLDNDRFQFLDEKINLIKSKIYKLKEKLS